jgi:hypothetical protein
MAFKWNDHTRKLSSVLLLLAPYWRPLFGHGVSAQQRSSQTAWVMLLRETGANAPKQGEAVCSDCMAVTRETDDGTEETP